ncbi:MAG TPA: hypothetical protein VF220_01080 [Nitrososphaeraceae archaeon]
MELDTNAENPTGMHDGVKIDERYATKDKNLPYLGYTVEIQVSSLMQT